MGSVKRPGGARVVPGPTKTVVRASVQRHVDDYEANDGAPSRRSVSFICYLNDPGAPAWTARDGGALRVHSGGAYYEILPDAGSLVLFDSMAVEHEVRPTRRERTCLIGWFHAPT